MIQVNRRRALVGEHVGHDGPEGPAGEAEEEELEGQGEPERPPRPQAAGDELELGSVTALDAGRERA